MKSLLSTCAALALAGALFVPAASAQTVVTPRQESLGLPSGPYLLSCTGAHAVNGSLVALCDDRAAATRDAMDTWHTAQMPLAQAQQCNGAIEHINGTLTCATAPMVGSSTPPQNYRSSFGTSGPTYGSSGAAMTPSSATPYEVNPSGYPEGQPVVRAPKSYYPGSSAAPQNYGSSFGTSSPAYGTPGAAMTESPATPPYATGAPGYPEGQPTAPATKPYYSQPSAGSSMAPQNYGSSYGASSAPYDRYTTGTPGQPRTPPNPD
jgi:hypothetical protein